jgi:hypothetical protein
MLSSSSSSSSAAFQKSQQQWDKKRSAASSTSNNNNSNSRRRPSDLAWQSPLRLRLFGGASAVMMTTAAAHRPNNNGRQVASPPSTTRKMYLSPQMMTAIKNEIEGLPLPATLACVAMTLLHSTDIWDAPDDDIIAAVAHDKSDTNYNNNLNVLAKQNNNNNTDDELRLANDSKNYSPTAHSKQTVTANNDDDDDDLSKYFSGITIQDEMQQRQNLKLQFDNVCKGLITKGNHVMLTSWGQVREKLGEEFLFSSSSTLILDDEEGEVVNEGGVGDESAAASEANDEATMVVAAAAATPTRRTQATAAPTTPMSSKRRSFGPNKKIPKKSHHTSPKPTQRRSNIKLKKVLGRVVAQAAKKKTWLGLDAYKHKLLDKMGKSKYNQMFQQATISPAKHLLLLDDTAQRLDDQIADLESTRRKTKQDELLEMAERERQARESASKLLRPLTPEETQIVKNAIYGIGPKDDILASQDADSVQRESMHRLQPGQWLNDEVINYFLKNCLAKRDEKLCAKQAGRKRSHFFNSFFVQTMFDEKNSNSSLRGRYNYKNVRRWSKKVPGKDIFNLKYIFCPINLDNMHWTSACIFMEQKKIQYYDSMGGTDWGKLEGLLEYLKDEWKAKKGGEMDVSEWELVGCQEGSPRQLNGECLFVCCCFAYVSSSHFCGDDIILRKCIMCCLYFDRF